MPTPATPTPRLVAQWVVALRNKLGPLRGALLEDEVLNLVLPETVEGGALCHGQAAREQVERQQTSERLPRSPDNCEG